MAPSSQNLGFLPILALAADLSRSSIASAYHYSLFSTNALTDSASEAVPGMVCMKGEDAQ